MVEYLSMEQIKYDSIALKYILTTPTDFSKSEKLPLIVFLHGAGERGDDIEKLKIYGIPKIFCNNSDFCGIRAITLSPLCPAEITWIDLKKEVFSLIEKVCAEYNVDIDRISLCGVSMGGFGVWEMAMSRPEMFSAISPMCAGGMNWRAQALKNVPIRVFHGRLDDVVPLVQSEIMVSAVRAAGGEIEFTIYDDLSHNCWDRAFENTDLISWLVSEKINCIAG